MKIKTVIRAFKKLLPIYEEAYNLKIIDAWKYYKILDKKHVLHGLCLASIANRFLRLDIFGDDGYYKNYINDHYLYNSPYHSYVINMHNPDEKFIIKEMKKSLKFRIDFLKREIKHLEKLSLKYDEI